MKYKFMKLDSAYGLDVGVISDSDYDILKPIIEHLGGHWREKVKLFLFNTDISSKLEYYLKNGITITEKYKYQESTQFYPTPKEVAERVVELCNIHSGDFVLEPSAGQGGLVDCIKSPCKLFLVEPLKENCLVLHKKGYSVVRETFEKVYLDCVLKEVQFDKIVMNPPFSGQRDIKHFMMAYGLLKKGGTLVSIISENALYYDTTVSHNFNCFLKNKGAYIENVPFRAFEDSGTTIETVIVKIKK